MDVRRNFLFLIDVRCNKLWEMYESLLGNAWTPFEMLLREKQTLFRIYHLELKKNNI